MEISELQAEIDRQLEDYRIGKVKKRKDGNFGVFMIYIIYNNNKRKRIATNLFRYTE